MRFSTISRCTSFAIVTLTLLIVWPVNGQERKFYTPPPLDSVQAVSAEHGMVVAQEKLAAIVGADILRQGGNAVDAAVATGFALAVTYPRAGNIGGGGFMVIHSTGGGPGIPRDRAISDNAGCLPRSRRQARSGEVARLRPRYRGARHRRGAGAGA